MSGNFDVKKYHATIKYKLLKIQRYKDIIYKNGFKYATPHHLYAGGLNTKGAL